MPAPNTVWVLTQTLDKYMTVLTVFESEEAATSRVVGWIKKGDMDKLIGLELKRHTVMTS